MCPVTDWGIVIPAETPAASEAKFYFMEKSCVWSSQAQGWIPSLTFTTCVIWGKSLNTYKLSGSVSSAATQLYLPHHMFGGWIGEVACAMLYEVCIQMEVFLSSYQFNNKDLKMPEL